MRDLLIIIENVRNPPPIPVEAPKPKATPVVKVSNKDILKVDVFTALDKRGYGACFFTKTALAEWLGTYTNVITNIMSNGSGVYRAHAIKISEVCIPATGYLPRRTSFKACLDVNLVRKDRRRKANPSRQPVAKGEKFLTAEVYCVTDTSGYGACFYSLAPMSVWLGVGDAASRTSRLGSREFVNGHKITKLSLKLRAVAYIPTGVKKVFCL